MKKIIAVIPVKGRLPLLKKTIQRLINVNNCYAVICLGDSIEEEKACRNSGAYFIYHENYPLGKKWNAGFLAAKDLCAEACLFVGSSDWIGADWFNKISEYLDEYDLIGKLGFHLIDIEKTVEKNNYRACYWNGYNCNRKGESIGIGRVISSNILNKIGWKPFLDNKDNGMDYCMQNKIINAGGKIKIIDDNDMDFLSISTNLWGNKHKFNHHWNGILSSGKINADEVIFNFKEIKEIF